MRVRGGAGLCVAVGHFERFREEGRRTSVSHGSHAAKRTIPCPTLPLMARRRGLCLAFRACHNVFRPTWFFELRRHCRSCRPSSAKRTRFLYADRNGVGRATEGSGSGSGRPFPHFFPTSALSLVGPYGFSVFCIVNGLGAKGKRITWWKSRNLVLSWIYYGDYIYQYHSIFLHVTRTY